MQQGGEMAAASGGVAVERLVLGYRKIAMGNVWWRRRSALATGGVAGGAAAPRHRRKRSLKRRREGWSGRAMKNICKVYYIENKAAA